MMFPARINCAPLSDGIWGPKTPSSYRYSSQSRYLLIPGNLIPKRDFHKLLEKINEFSNHRARTCSILKTKKIINYIFAKLSIKYGDLFNTYVRKTFFMLKIEEFRQFLTNFDRLRRKFRFRDSTFNPFLRIFGDSLWDSQNKIFFNYILLKLLLKYADIVYCVARNTILYFHVKKID
jgi:hypothetical protein